MKNLEELQHKIDEIFFPEHSAQLRAKIAKAIELIQTGDDETVLAGESKIGGEPDLHWDVDWPEYEGKAMTFLGQFELEKLHRLVDNELPQKGTVYFFAHFDDETTEFIPNKDKYALLFYNGPQSELETYEFPDNLEAKCRLRQSYFQMTLFYHLPSIADGYWSEHTSIDDGLLDWRLNLLEENYYAEGINLESRRMEYVYPEQLLGYPYGSKKDILVEWGKSYFNTKALNEEQRAFVKSERENFIHLLSFEMGKGHYFGAKLPPIIGYWGIHLEDLKNNDFSKALLVFEKVDGRYEATME